MKIIDVLGNIYVRASLTGLGNALFFKVLRCLGDMKYVISLEGYTAAVVRKTVSAKRRCQLRVYMVSKLRRLLSGFGGLKVACWPFVPKCAGSNLAETFGFFRAKKSSSRLPSEGN